jgi:UDP-glucuronate decarboxylase
VVSNFIMQALGGHPLTVFGDGSQTRSFCYVDDTVEALVRMMGTEHDVTGPINIGNPHEITVLELAERIQAAVDHTRAVMRLPLPADDPRQRQPDIERAKAELGWKPEVALEEGLARTVAWFQGAYSGTSAEDVLGAPVEARA